MARKATAHDIFNDYTLVGVCIMSKDYFGFVLGSNTTHREDIKYTFATHIKSRAPQGWGLSRWKSGSWNTPVIAHTVFNEFIVIDKDAGVWYQGVGDNKVIENRICGGTGIGVKDVVNIDGTIFAPGLSRSVYVYIGPNEWVEYDEPYYAPGADKVKSKGFSAMDGFSKEDIYVAGGNRDVWHFNYTTKEWMPIDISAQGYMGCNTVCCAEDGVVYIGGDAGQLAWGRGDIWQHVDLNTEQDIKKIVSYQGKIFVGTEQGTYTLKPIKDNEGEDSFELELYWFEELPDFSGGHMLYTAYGMLMVGNYFNQVAYHNGEKWINIHGCYEPNRFDDVAEKKEQAKKLVELAEDLEKINKRLEGDV